MFGGASKGAFEGITDNICALSIEADFLIHNTDFL